MESTTVYIGTEIKLNVNIAPSNGVVMDDYDFEMEVFSNTLFSSAKKVVIKKSEATRVDESNYMICIDTSIVGVGELTCRIVAHIPDGDFADGLRTEVVVVNTGIKIVNA